VDPFTVLLLQLQGLMEFCLLALLLISVPFLLVCRLLCRPLPAGFWTVNGVAAAAAIWLPFLTKWLLRGQIPVFALGVLMLAFFGWFIGSGFHRLRRRLQAGRAGLDQRWYLEIPARWRKE
jgi:hypothetical protein